MTLITVSALAVLAGCGGSGSSTSASPSGAPVRGGDLVIARTADSQSMNNTTVFDNESIWVFEQIFQPLYTVTPDGKGVTPMLATSYTVSADKKTYTFTLRSGVKFSNGKAMTSADVKFSLDQARAAAKGLSLFSNAIVPANYGGETETQFYQAPVGTGPFKWDYWHKGSALKLVRNPYYWQPGKPYLNSVTWTDVASDNTRELQLKGGQAQVDEFPAWSTVSSLKSTPNVTMNLFNSTRTDYLSFNELRKPFQDVHVRRAMSLAVNRAALVKAVLFGNGKPANSLFPPQVPYYQQANQGLQYDLTAAKQEMAKSGVPHGFAATILVPAGYSDDVTIATILQSELKPLGITLTIQQLDPNTVTTDQQSLK